MPILKRARSRYWYTNFVFAGRTVRQSTGTADRAQAEEYEAKLRNSLWEQQRLGVKPRYLWEAAVVDYLGLMPEGVNKRHTRLTLAWLGKRLAGQHLDDVGRGKLVELQKEKLREGAKPATVNRVLGVAIAVLNKAVEWEWLDRAPKLAAVPTGPKRLRYLTREQAEALLLELPLHSRHMAIFALETGLRRANVTHMRWDWIDFGRAVAVVPAHAVKGQTRTITVPLSQTALALLHNLGGVGIPSEGFVFTYRGKPVTQTATRAFRAALSRAGIQDFRWHDLRHTWASWHAQGNTPDRILQELGGWQSSKMVIHYAHLAAAHLAPFVERHAGLSETVVGDKISDTSEVATSKLSCNSLIQKQSGNSSVGRAQPCQGEGCSKDKEKQ